MVDLKSLWVVLAMLLLLNCQKLLRFSIKIQTSGRLWRPQSRGSLKLDDSHPVEKFQLVSLAHPVEEPVLRLFRF